MEVKGGGKTVTGWSLPRQRRWGLWGQQWLGFLLKGGHWAIGPVGPFHLFSSWLCIWFERDSEGQRGGEGDSSGELVSSWKSGLVFWGTLSFGAQMYSPTFARVLQTLRWYLSLMVMI